MEFLLGGTAACGAGFFSNPLDVVKIRMQLQGELQARGAYAVRYRNSFHAVYMVAKVDGLLALQKGLVPALGYQLIMNGIRLGSYQTFIDLGLTKNGRGEVSVPRSVLAGAVAGCIGAFVGSPMYLVKIHLQSQADARIAVGYQHKHDSTASALRDIYRNNGIRGLWSGVTSAIPRVMVGSATQLATFSKSKQLVENLELFPRGHWLNTLLASISGGAVVVLFMTPFDVVSTRLYNQGLDKSGRGFYYSGFMDCVVKMWTKESPFSFYKGWTANLLRLGPHTVLTLVFWDELRKLYGQMISSSNPT